jgi:hypothetical protein
VDGILDLDEIRRFENDDAGLLRIERDVVDQLDTLFAEPLPHGNHRRSQIQPDPTLLGREVCAAASGEDSGHGRVSGAVGLFPVPRELVGPDDRADRGLDVQTEGRRQRRGEVALVFVQRGARRGLVESRREGIGELGGDLVLNLGVRRQRGNGPDVPIDVVDLVACPDGDHR